MVLFLVRHQHTDETCPTPKMGPMLLQHISEANAAQMGINIHGKMAGGHTFVAILEAENKQKVEEFMSPFAQAGWVEITAGVTCEEVVEGQTCDVGLTMAIIPTLEGAARSTTPRSRCPRRPPASDCGLNGAGTDCSGRSAGPPRPGGCPAS